MPCHISDGPQTPEDQVLWADIDEDDAYEQYRQEQIDLSPPLKTVQALTNRIAKKDNKLQQYERRIKKLEATIERLEWAMGMND